MALTDADVVARDTETAVRECARRFIALDRDVLRTRWEQGAVIADLWEMHGNDAVAQLALAVGHGRTQLMKLADFYNEYESVDNLNPSVPITFYIEAAREFRAVREDEDAAKHIDDRPEDWAERAREEHWSAGAMRRSIREKYGMNGLNTLVRMVNDPDSMVHRALDGDAVYAPGDYGKAIDICKRVARDVGVTGVDGDGNKHDLGAEAVVGEVNGVAESLRPAATAAVQYVHDALASRKRDEAARQTSAFHRAMADQLGPDAETHLLTFRVTTVSTKDPDAVAQAIRSALLLAGCNATTVTHVRKPQAAQDQAHVVA